MTPHSTKHTHRKEPSDTPLIQCTRPNTPQYTRVVTELNDTLLELASLEANQYVNHFLKTPNVSVPLLSTLLETHIECIIQKFNNHVLQLNKDEKPALTPLPPYASAHATTPVPPPQVPKVSAAMQTDEETLRHPPPQCTYTQATTMTNPQPTPAAPGTLPCAHHPCSHPVLLKPFTSATPSSHLVPKMVGQRVVVHIGKSMHYSARLGIPAVLPKFHRDTSDAQKKEESALQCLGVKLSHTKNLVIIFPAKVSKSAIDAAFPTLRNMLLLPQGVCLSFDTPWSHLLFANLCSKSI